MDVRIRVPNIESLSEVRGSIVTNDDDIVDVFGLQDLKSVCGLAGPLVHRDVAGFRYARVAKCGRSESLSTTSPLPFGETWYV